MPPIELKDYSVSYAIGFVGNQLHTHADGEYKRQLTRIIRFATDIMYDHRDGITLADFWSRRYRAEIEFPKEVASDGS